MMWVKVIVTVIFISSCASKDVNNVTMTADPKSDRLLLAKVPEYELVGIDFFLTFIKQLASLAMFMAIGIPIAYNHLAYAVAKTLFGLYPYMKFYM